MLPKENVSLCKIMWKTLSERIILFYLYSSLKGPEGNVEMKYKKLRRLKLSTFDQLRNAKREDII